MRFTVVFAVLLSLLVGCSRGPNIEGTWKPDREALVSTEDYKKASDEEKKQMEAALDGMTVEIGPKTMKMSLKVFGNEVSQEASYTIKKTEGNKVTVETKDEKDKVETVVLTVDGDTMTLPADKGRPDMKLKRQ